MAEHHSAGRRDVEKEVEVPGQRQGGGAGA